MVTIDNQTDKACTRISFDTLSQPGLLPALSSTFQDFGVDVVKTTLDRSDGRSHGVFLVQSQSGSKLADGMEVDRLQRAVESLLETRFSMKIPRRPQVGGTRDADQRTALLYGLMGAFWYELLHEEDRLIFQWFCMEVLLEATLDASKAAIQLAYK